MHNKINGKIAGRYGVFICILITFLWNDVQAQKGVVFGTVYDAETSEIMPHANIIVEGRDKGTYSKFDGSYKLKLDTGRVDIRFRFLSYKDTVVTVNIRPNSSMQRDVYLKPDYVSMDGITVSSNRAARKVQKLANIRNQRRSNLKNYKAEVYKLAILSYVDEDFDYKNVVEEELDPIAFSERLSKVKYVADPERISETLVAHRASENFFSEYDFFSTGGEPLNLNKDEVALSILSEGITVVGPVSSRAEQFYELYEEDADSTWPAGTVRIYFEPKTDNRPLFIGSVWFDDERSVILGIDVKLNDYSETNTGTFKIWNLHYEQSYQKIGDFWLPETTELSAMIQFFTSNKPIYYHDEWNWEKLQVNQPEINPTNIQLSTIHIQPGAHKKEETFWDTLSYTSDNKNFRFREEAGNYEEENKMVEAGMTAMQGFFRLPYQLERFYLTNFSDIYHYNRVEGHFLGLGLRTPVHPDYDYRISGGFGFGNKSTTYSIGGYHFIGNDYVAPEGRYFKETVAQYQDYEYNRTPLDFFETRQTLQSLSFGTNGNNYFEREGIMGGLRFRASTESFLRVLYMNERHRSLQSSSRVNLFGSHVSPVKYVNNDPVFPAEEGAVKGLYLQLHHDTRQYHRTQFLRDYNIRKFGWLADVVLEKGMNAWDSDYNYNRLRLGLKFYWPVFSSHFFQTDIIFGVSDGDIPNQRMYTYNGYVVDDYVRYRPFNTVSYRKPLGNRISQIRLRYKFGSSLTRSIPIDFIRKSGIQISTLLTVGVVDQTTSFEPLLPYSGSQTQAEFGIAASKILGIFYTEFSKKLYGPYGSSIGLKVLF